MKGPLFIRADGGVGIGTGHVMRCLGLAQAWQGASGPAAFLHAETTPALEELLCGERIETIRLPAERGTADDATQTIKLACARGAKWIVADGYCFDTTWQKRIRDAGLRLLIVDDYGQTDQYHADLVLNQNLGAAESLYAGRDPDTRLLLGPRFALLRREFLDRPRLPREILAVARKVLVTLGGSDPDNVTTRVIDALAHLADIEAVVVLGGSNPHLDAVKERLASQPSIRLVVNATNMPAIMAWADVAVSAAGSTAWELAFMGVPTVLIVTADNQSAIAEALHREGVSLSLGLSTTLTGTRIAGALHGLLLDGSLRQKMCREGRQLVDGLGVDRVLSSLAA